MYYIVGLGNPGEKYTNTRHNVGFMVLAHVQRKLHFPEFHESRAHSGAESVGVLRDKEVTLLMPETFMNASGSAVRKLVHKGAEEQLCVIYDDIDLPIGEIKISKGRGDGGHNGIKSVIESLGTKEFVRVRVGIAQKSMWSGKPVRPKGEALAKYVLHAFSKKEIEKLDAVAATVTQALAVFVEDGASVMMNKFN